MEDRIREKLDEVRRQIDWDNTTGSARKWWEEFEAGNAARLELVMRLAEELAVRKATITEFFLAVVFTNVNSIQANLHYLDYYTRLKKEDVRKKKVGAEKTEGTRQEDEEYQAACEKLGLTNAPVDLQDWWAGIVKRYGVDKARLRERTIALAAGEWGINRVRAADISPVSEPDPLSRIISQLQAEEAERER